jgi:DNA-binding response OmpR family regulator
MECTMTDNSQTTVVIADDDADIRALVAIAVDRAGFDLVATAEDGTQAYAAILEHRPDLVVLDVSMPGMTGLEVSRLVRNDIALDGTMIVMLSAAVDEQSRDAGFEAGASHFLSKPFSPRELAIRLSDLMPAS